MTFKLRIRIIACLCLSPFLSIAQDHYTARWKTVDSLINIKGLPQSALAQVNQIYTRAQQEKNEPQLLKALIYRIQLQNGDQEDAGIRSVTGLEKEITGTKQPARSILQSLQASLYWDYFQQHRYQLYHRTKTENFIKDSIATWGAEDFHKKIGQLFLASLQEEKLLQSTRLDAYDPLIIKGNVRVLRPTLFDLLAHRALDYFKSDERDVNKPAYAFEIDDPAVFADAAGFTRRPFKTSDSSSLHHKALLLFQRLIGLHLADARPDALLDVDIERLNFVHNYAVMENKEELYTSGLVRITDRWPNEPAASEAWYLQALEHVNKAGSYHPPQDTSGRFEYLAAKSICDKVVTQKDSSEGKVHCTQLLRQILAKSLQLQIENVNIPGRPFRSLVSWRNFSRLYGRIVRISHDERMKLGNNTYEDNFWQKLLKLPLQQTFVQTLPGTNDYQQHQVEISIDALPIGSYALIAGDDSTFSLGKNLMSVAYFHVSKIAYINNVRDYFVLDRESGQPLPGAAVQIWTRYYDNKAGREAFARAETYRADEHGHFQLKKREVNRNYTQVALEITAGSDHLFIDETYNLFYEQSRLREETGGDKSKYEKDNLRTWFFTDRSIYRPGQTVYFKGIVQTRDADTHKAKILPQFSTKVILYDVNGSKVDSLSVTSNDFGSYHGQFRLPEHLLNGEFSIRDDSSGIQESFAVEEYKRPLFFVSYDTLKGTYRVGDTIRVKGSAKAFAGNVIDGAMVKYTVRRQARIPCFDCWPMMGRFLPGRNNEQEIAHGTIRTDAQGRFTISFGAAPDRTVNKATDPVFEYTIAADVTDLNGETRSGSTVVKAGYKTLQLTIDGPSDNAMPSDSLKSLVVGARNLNDVPEPAFVNISMYALKAPDRLIRKRYWDEPDQFILSKEEYLRNFPHDEYSNETNAAYWEKGAQIWQTSDSTGKKLNIGKSLSPGWYVIEASAKDKYGQPVKVIRYVGLFEAGTGKPATPQYAWSLQDEETVEPGGKATLDIGSSAENVFVIRRLSTTDSVGALSFLTLDKGMQRTSFPVTEANRGGFGIGDVFVKDNRIYTRNYTVHVPWTNKELSIHYDTYRDKVLPGNEEKWKVTIKGRQADKVAAEALAGMYDASLDQFKYHEWSVPAIYPVFSSGMAWNGASNFAAANATPRYVQEREYPSFLKQYDELMAIHGGNRYGQVRLRGIRTMAPGQPGAVLNMEVKGSDMYVRSDKMSKNVSGRVPGLQALYKDDATATSDSVATIVPELPADAAVSTPVQIRRNFNETAFFFPELKTDDSGSVTFSFTMPEALTKWKWMVLAHTKDLSFGYSEKTVVTQKKLMVQPNAPRFLREGDRMELGVKVVNLTDSEMTGQIELQLIDPTTGLTADGIFSNRQANQYFTVAAGQSAVASFPLDIPYQYNRPLTYRIIARSKENSDGEEAVLPVVSNRMLVTESLPLNLPADGVKAFHFDKLLQSGSSETLNHHALTVEFTSNPAWYAVQALPYLMEYPYECAEQTFNRFYANALASKIAGSSPRIRQIFDKWKTTDTAALLSNLEKNQELKSVLLQETPWVLQGKTESQQKQHIALLFDMVRMSRELESSLAKLKDMQSDNGGFVWFKGGPDDRYITQYILTGIGHLQHLDAVPPSMAAQVKAIVQTALPYLDSKLKKDYEDILKQQKTNKPLPAGKKAGPVWIGETPIQYLYMRSFFSDYGIPGDVFPAVNYFRKQARDGWLQTSKYMQGMIALALFRTGDVYTAKNILASLKETAIRDEEKGMYWKGMEGGYYWYQAPIETQSLLTEAFHEIAPASGLENALRTWLLRQKQTHNWTTTKATADACYALLMGNSDWLSAERKVDIRLGSKTASSDAADAEAGTGYFKKVFDGPFVQPSMGNITVTMKTTGTGGPASPAGGSPAWGAVYWQYFENLDKITSATNAKAPLKLTKKLFIEKNTDRGPVLEPVPENGVLHPGDKVKVRIEIQSDRSMEYVHMKDMRAACMEPVNVLSGYKWQGGLGYYESTRDASTDFFFSYLPRGTFVFEYPLFVGQAGNFSNGVTSIECMYAPEFGYHSEGIRVNVEEAKP
ncbi:alpha-2-macroglobulin family protein [Flavitalea sp. BT771]|uniref:alpha-2-macroglobulin family protein n=1 Tax=Flavitalea sp. BT771 TaxID=3063329 RepID=UPI0026E16216|nr:alpha-2-macroglobulin family protein [Flavitalea sp. BT771]MDO6429158.1 alpha-2-macroglobulin family protein [Flavitalea sp. BT771]MDV6218714.1 alpha-2-macroglobulin family protein [Flavitalea sp. BT771]